MRRSQPFVDWMKAIGLILIVFGHVAHASTVWIAPPIYIKQFGVAFFVFATGFTLAREVRPAWQVVYQRLFEVCLFGILCALAISALGAATGTGLQRSNYLPFVLGVNITIDAFPANPTTWYIGTYIHLLLLWALLLRRIAITPRLVAGVFVAEIAVRAVLLSTAGPFVAYMALSNWASVLLLGMLYGTRHVGQPWPRLRFTAALTVFVAVWALAMRVASPVPTFPLMSFDMTAASSAMLVSIGVSTLYLTVTWLSYAALNGMAASRVVQLVARNSVIVFIVHMPLYYATAPWVNAITTAYWGRVAVRLLICLVGLTFVSEGVHRLVAVPRLRDRLAAIVIQLAARRAAPRRRMREA
ncbi:MAG: acyltransferase [Acidobacteria bacterium]|nr:acyltransferase [Acidobacteriota bacterium]